MVTDKGLAGVAANCSRLLSLSLKFCRSVTDEGLAAVAGAGGCNKLLEVRVGINLARPGLPARSINACCLLVGELVATQTFAIANNVACQSSQLQHST